MEFVSYMPIYAPNITYGLRFVYFYRNYNVYPVVYIFVSSVIGFYHFAKFRCSTHLVSEIANVLPEDVYCCFTRTTLFTTMFTVLILCLSF